VPGRSVGRSGAARWDRLNLFARLGRLSVDYQAEREDFEPDSPVRPLALALLELSADLTGQETLRFLPGEVSRRIEGIVSREGRGKALTPKQLGWLLKKLRFKRPESRTCAGKSWTTTRAEVEALARS
jgi:hypothetical protein